jgi:chromate transporter
MPGVVAIVAQALWALGRSAIRSAALAGVGVCAMAAALWGVPELAVLGGAGAAMAGSRAVRRGRSGSTPLLIAGAAASTSAGLLAAGTTASTAAVGLWPLFVSFVRIGSVIFGSGYVLLAFLRADLVDRLAWLSERQLLDAVAIGQVTPGPLFTTATFIGYLLAGSSGAAVATLGIFLPAFVLVVVSGPLVPRLRQSPTLGAFLDGVVVASLALMVVVAGQIGRATLTSPLSAALAIGSAVALMRYRVNSAWVIGAGALVGLLTTA